MAQVIQNNEGEWVLRVVVNVVVMRMHLRVVVVRVMVRVIVVRE